MTYPQQDDQAASTIDYLGLVNSWQLESEEAIATLSQQQPEDMPPVMPAHLDPVPWRPATGYLARMTRRRTNLRINETVYIDYVYDNCGDRHCDTCANVSVMYLRPSEPHESCEYQVSHSSVPINALAPVTPATGDDYVRCDTLAHSRNDHPFIDGECVRPFATLRAGDEGVFDALLPEFRARFDMELAQREQTRAAMLARRAGLRQGDRYRINSVQSSYYGCVATVREVPSGSEDIVICEIRDSDGYMVRNHSRLSVFDLGTRYSAWQFGNQVPQFIRWGEPTRYSGMVTVTDREVSDGSDTGYEHECGNSCFDYGCTERRGSSSDYDDDDDAYQEDGVTIHSYSYRPNLIFMGDGPVFLGTELELSTGNNEAGARAQAAAAKLITEAMGDAVYLKQDGSISGHGFEAVFHPMSYDWLVANWPEDLLRDMRRIGAMPHSSCGMHVHVSRSGFSDPVHAYKWLKFMYRNEREMTRLARRDPSSWGSFGRPVERAAAKWHAKGGYGSESRYTAVNCSPPHTYEVRIFASTLNRTRFLGSLGLVDASVEYTRKVTTGEILKDAAWTFGPFREYVHSFNKYKPLQREMVRLLDQ